MPIASRRRRLPAVILATLLLTGLGAIGFIVTLSWWMTGAMNDVARQNSDILVTGAFDALVKRLEVSVADYSYWEDHYEWIMARDDEQMLSNVGSGATDGATFQLAYIVDHTGKPIYAYKAGGEASDISIVDREVATVFADALAKSEIDGYSALSGYARIDGVLFAIAATWVLPEDFASLDRSDIPIMIAGLELTDELVQEIADEYLVDDLIIVDKPPDQSNAEGALPLEGIGGDTVAHVRWRYARPGNMMKERAAPVIVLMSALLMLCVLVAGRASSAQARQIISEKEHAREAARTDSLTGLINRWGLHDLMSGQDMRRAMASGGVAVIYMDINGFKHINDLVGHVGGDQALMIMATRLAQSVRECDFVARVGGDEFVAVILDDNPSWAVDVVCDRLEKVTSAPVRVGGEMRLVRGAIGVAVAEKDTEFADLMTRADVAMYRAKEDRSLRHVVYTQALKGEHEWQRSVENRLRQGLRVIDGAENPFTLVYQPVIDLTTGGIACCEALLRWRDEELGTISPQSFVPVAEARGLVPALGEFVLRECCRRMRDMPELNVSINVSPLQLISPSFTDMVRDTAMAAGLAPSRFQLEITESALIEVPDTARIRMTELLDAGFRLALDDFGTGYASISYLRRFQFHTLKIDKSFVKEIGSGARERDLFATLVSLGGNFGLTVVAEGIETAKQAAAAKRCGCFMHQGFYYAKPMPFEELVTFARTVEPRAAG